MAIFVTISETVFLSLFLLGTLAFKNIEFTINLNCFTLNLLISFSERKTYGSG